MTLKIEYLWHGGKNSCAYLLSPLADTERVAEVSLTDWLLFNPLKPSELWARGNCTSIEDGKGQVIWALADRGMYDPD